MKKITLALLSVLLITALGGCKSTTPQTADKNVKPALMWLMLKPILNVSAIPIQ